MAEFCKECFEKIEERKYNDDELIISKNDDFCERCCRIKPIVIAVIVVR